MNDASNDASGPGWVLLDAAAEHEDDPAGLPIPTLAERAALRPGDIVKLVFLLDPAPSSGPNAERMWVEVTKAHPDGTYDGSLTNAPVVIASLGASHPVGFERRHVAGIALPDEDIRFDVTLHAVASVRALEQAHPPRWVTCDEPLADDDSGWTVTSGDEPEEYFKPGDPRTTVALTLGELVTRFPALVEVFQAGEGEWTYQPDRRRYVRSDRPR